MELSVFLAVLAAAVMHAGWNVLVKLKLDRFLSLCLIQTLMGFMGLVMLAVFPAPALTSLPYAVASGVLHLGLAAYILVLQLGYFGLQGGHFCLRCGQGVKRSRWFSRHGFGGGGHAGHVGCQMGCRGVWVFCRF